MTPLVAVAVGDRAVSGLRSGCAIQISAGETAFVIHDDLAVAHSVTSRWVHSYDHDGVLVVVDGSLHGLDGTPHDLADPSGNPARAVHRRYLEHGIDVAAGLLGDYVAVVLDRASGRLVVSRDPVGVRPWYQATSGRQHAGATDIATLAALDWVDTAIDETVAIAHLAAITLSRGGTVFAGITTLAPGTTWSRDRSGTRVSAHHRWDLDPDLSTSWDDAVDRCRRVMDEVVRSRMGIAAQPTGELSGGLDSSAVIGTMATMAPGEVMAGRLIFDTPRADERVYSDAVAAHWGIPMESAPPTIIGDDELSEITRELRIPAPDPHFAMFTGLHRALAERGRHANLTGLGGDDAFAAFDNGSRALSSVQLRQWRVLRQLAHFTVRHPQRAWGELVTPVMQRLTSRDHPPFPGWVRREAADRAGIDDLLRQRPERVTGVDAIDLRIDNLTSGYNAAILETRATVGDGGDRRDTHPFLDPRFITATYGLDPWWPTDGRIDRALQVAAYRDRLPPVVAERTTKADFSEVFWPELLRDHVLQRVRTGPLVELGWLDIAGFDAVVADAKEGKAFRAIPLSRCISVDRWLRYR